jgi:hypothetical protein
LAGNQTSNGLKAGEYVAVYLKNDSVNKITVSEIRLAGSTYDFQSFASPQALPVSTTAGGAACGDSDTAVDCKEYTMVTQADAGANNDGLVSVKSSPELEPGQEATMILALEKDVKVGRDLQYKLTTTNGAVFVSTVNSGQQSG